MKQFVLVFLLLIFTPSISAQTKLQQKKTIKVKTKECRQMVSFGVIPQNLVIDVPKPKYPNSAKAINLQDTVTVQVIINKRAKVIRANVLNGHIFLRKASLDSAWNSKFKVFELSSNPVCYVAILQYRFRK